MSSGSSTGSVTLSTMVLEVRKPSNQYPIGKMRGTGSMDPFAVQVSPTKILVADTASVQYDPNEQSGVQGMLTLLELTKDGPKIVGQQLLPREQGERVHMKMNLVPLDYKTGNQTAPTKTGLNEYKVLLTYATEDNQGDNGNQQAGTQGSNNGNPQTVAWLLKVNGAPSGATNSTALDISTPAGLGGQLTTMRKVNLVSLTGQQDGQQYGAEGISCNGSTCMVGLQRNNATTNISMFTVNDDGTMSRVAARRTNNNNGQHSRPVLTADFKGRTFEGIVDTNDQPARAVRLWELASGNAQTVKTRQVMTGSQTGNEAANVYVSRPYVGVVRDLSTALNPAAAAALQAKSPVFVFGGVVKAVRNRNQLGGDNQNGHGGGSTTTLLMALDPDTFDPLGGTLPQLSNLPIGDDPSAIKVNPAPFGRHASAFIANAYGPVGSALPAAVVLGASSTGSAPGFAQFMPFDPVTGKFDVRANKNKFNLGYADIANATKGKRNPQNQAGSFLQAVTDVENPFYGDPTSKQPEVKSYTIVPVNGAFNLQGDTADKTMGLRVSFIPQTWTEKVNVTPGPAVDVKDVPVGPAPVTKTKGPAAGKPGGDDQLEDTEDGSGDETGSTSGLGGRQAGGEACAMGPGSTSTSGLGGFAIAGLGLAAMMMRRKREE
ncbi:MAG: hypothetical protein U0169_07885 [Polyangiaceae bacterium]